MKRGPQSEISILYANTAVNLTCRDWRPVRVRDALRRRIRLYFPCKLLALQMQPPVEYRPQSSIRPDQHVGKATRSAKSMGQI
jgi:hypothetical protein